MYTYSYLDQETGQIEEKKVAKGTKKNVKKRFLTLDFYEDALFTLNKCTAVQNTFLSQRHIISSVSTRKIVLSAFDTKRWICDDGITTLANGNYDAK